MARTEWGKRRLRLGARSACAPRLRFVEAPGQAQQRSTVEKHRARQGIERDRAVEGRERGASVTTCGQERSEPSPHVRSIGRALDGAPKFAFGRLGRPFQNQELLPTGQMGFAQVGVVGGA